MDHIFQQLSGAFFYVIYVTMTEGERVSNYLEATCKEAAERR